MSLNNPFINFFMNTGAKIFLIGKETTICDLAIILLCTKIFENPLNMPKNDSNDSLYFKLSNIQK